MDDLGSELLRLIVGTGHERHAADAGRKAEIVLDAGGSAGLATEGAAVEHQDREPFGGGIDGSGQSGRAGPHDGDVIDLVRVDRAHETDAAGEFDLARVMQKLPARAHDNRQSGGIEMELLDQRAGLFVRLGVEALMRMAVAAQEVSKPQHVAVAGAADDHRAAAAGLDQPDASQNQGPHDALAEVGFRDQQRPQPVGRDDERVHRRSWRRRQSALAGRKAARVRP